MEQTLDFTGDERKLRKICTREHWARHCGCRDCELPKALAFSAKTS
jgi:hypothetical protein